MSTVSPAFRSLVAIALAALVVSTATAQARPDTKAAVSLPRPTGKPVWPDEGPATWAPRPTVPAITANDLRTRLYQLADDSMMGRRIEIGRAHV